ncbi:MAG TPA: M48 family metalloprotease [Phycisphaerales bacterium]|nr:M48 family metalloprotease [Phycisphaerales bacterium]
MFVFMNNLKTAALLGGLFALLVWVGSYWGTQGMIVFGTLALMMNVGSWFFSDKIAIAAMRGVEVNQQTAPDLHAIVAQLAQRANLPMPRIYVCPQEAPNAFATGRNPRHAAVAVTQGALRLLDHEELTGVLGHELAHVKNRDTLTSCIAATVAGLFSMMAQSAMWFGGYAGNRRDSNPLALVFMLLLGSLGAALIKAMISRSREYVADADGAKFAGSPHGLVSALQKLDAVAHRVPMQTPNPAMNNMFIVEPLMSRTLMNLFASHPPTEDRVRHLLSEWKS